MIGYEIIDRWHEPSWSWAMPWWAWCHHSASNVRPASLLQCGDSASSQIKHFEGRWSTVLDGHAKLGIRHISTIFDLSPRANSPGIPVVPIPQGQSTNFWRSCACRMCRRSHGMQHWTWELWRGLWGGPCRISRAVLIGSSTPDLEIQIRPFDVPWWHGNSCHSFLCWLFCLDPKSRQRKRVVPFEFAVRIQKNIDLQLGSAPIMPQKRGVLTAATWHRCRSDNISVLAPLAASLRWRREESVRRIADGDGSGYSHPLAYHQWID